MGTRSHGVKATDGRDLGQRVSVLFRHCLERACGKEAQLGSNAGYQTGSSTLPQAEMLGTILMVAINARLPIYKDGKVTDHF